MIVVQKRSSMEGLFRFFDGMQSCAAIKGAYFSHVYCHYN